MRLFAFALLAGISCVPVFAHDSCDLLYKQTQAFSDAGQRGEDGKITGFIYLRGKNSIVFKRVA